MVVLGYVWFGNENVWCVVGWDYENLKIGVLGYVECFFVGILEC